MKYRHNRFLGVTFCWEKTEAGTLRIGLAFCSPKEKGYTKKTGRRVAFSRFLSQPVFVGFEPAVAPEVAFIDFCATRIVRKFMRDTGVRVNHLAWVGER